MQKTRADLKEFEEISFARAIAGMTVKLTGTMMATQTTQTSNSDNNNDNNNNNNNNNNNDNDINVQMI